MIVKIENECTTKFIDCVSVFMRPEIHRADEPQPETEIYGLYITFSNGREITHPLSLGDRVWYLNENGKTIDKDFRMICQKLE